MVDVEGSDRVRRRLMIHGGVPRGELLKEEKKSFEMILQIRTC